MCRKEILKKFLEYDLVDALIDNDEIVDLISSNEIDSLSNEQLDIIEPYLSVICSGVNANGADIESHIYEDYYMDGEELLTALNNYLSNDFNIMCESCTEEKSYYDSKLESFLNE